MVVKKTSTLLLFSLLLHIALLLILVFSYSFSSLMPVVENSHKKDIINAVILGDTPKSALLPKPISTPKKVEEPKPTVAAKPIPTIDKNVIALKKIAEEKKIQDAMVAERKKQAALIEKNLLADLKKQHEKQKKLQQKNLQAQFEKTLKEQAEKSLRQQLLKENIRMTAKESKETEGEINKYKALILQAISEHWMVPSQANKKLYCELMIRLNSNGAVLDVQITKSSGDAALDTSARTAVLKASPLPVPEKTEAFQAFKQFVLKVKPENIIAHDTL